MTDWNETPDRYNPAVAGEPVTEAGRALLQQRQATPQSALYKAILAIEAEATQRSTAEVENALIARIVRLNYGQDPELALRMDKARAAIAQGEPR